MYNDQGLWLGMPASQEHSVLIPDSQSSDQGLSKGVRWGQLFASAFCSKQGVSGVSPTWAFNMQHPLSSHQSGASVDRGSNSPCCDVATKPGSQAVNGWSGV